MLSSAVTELVKAITHCRACGSGQLDEVVSFGSTPLNAFALPTDPPVEKAPLRICQCDRCGLYQLGDTVNRERLFSTYWYASSIAPQMVADLKDVMEYACRMGRVEYGSTILSVGLNDGCEMRFAPPGTRLIGIDPAQNLAAQSRESVDIYVNDFFPSERLPKIKCDAILTIACLYAMPNLGDVCAAIHDLLTDRGAWVVQVSYLPKTLHDGNVGDFVHEHLEYFSVETLERLVRQHDLHITDYQFNSVNGGSVRLAIRKGDGPETGLKDNPSRDQIHQFATHVRRNGFALQQLLDELKEEGKLIIGLGASTKFNSCMSIWGIGPDRLPYIADRNPIKWGRLTPTGVPIVSEEWARAQKPDVFLVAIFQFLESIRVREAEFLLRGGRFLLPFPEPHYDDVFPDAGPVANHRAVDSSLPRYSTGN